MEQPTTIDEIVRDICTIPVSKSKVRGLVEAYGKQCEERGRNAAVDYVNTNLMWGRNSAGWMTISPVHIAEVLTSARTEKSDV